MNSPAHEVRALARRLLRVLPPAIGLATILSCAAGGYAPQTPSMPAARAALRPELRLFYDALTDYGDWVLIEPHGFVFRPRVDFATFRPYEEGFWAPSDVWGWIWISAEPFGWATYHYGNWFWDRYQGWVWTPGVNWGPAWVTWEIAGSFAGWAPRGPQGTVGAGAPGGAYVYAPLASMGSTDLKTQIVTRAELGPAAATVEPLTEVVERDGVRVPLGPPLARVERARGAALQRVRIEDVPSIGPVAGAGSDETKPAAPTAAGIEAARRAGESAARAARAMIQRGGRAPAVLPVLRPAWIGAQADTPERRVPPAREAAGPDTTR